MTNIEYHCLPWNKELGWPAQKATVTTGCIGCNTTVVLDLDVPEGCLDISFHCPGCLFSRSPLMMGYLPKGREPMLQEEFTLLTEWDNTKEKFSLLTGPIDESNFPKITECPNKIYKFEKWNKVGNQYSSTGVHWRSKC